MVQHSPQVSLAIAAIRAFVTTGKTIDVPPETPEELLNTRAGTFVSLKKDGGLRGCIGTIEPTQDTLAREIIMNAVSAAVKDPRFMPVEPHELDGLTYSVDVLMPCEEVHDLKDLDPRRYGVVVESGGRRGLLLPDLEGVDAVEEQIDIARRKAGIPSGAPMKLYRFEVIRYH